MEYYIEIIVKIIEAIGIIAILFWFNICACNLLNFGCKKTRKLLSNIKKIAW